MAIKDFMTKEVFSVTSDTKISKAATLMEEKNVHRLPVIDNGKLVGLITEGTMKEASPSKATSLSVYEMNYLLNKTIVRDVMIHKVETISPDATLEDGVFMMRSKNIGVLPVVEGEQVVGIITDKDIFDAFLHVAGYGELGARVILKFSKEEDHPGSLAKVVELIASKEINIQTLLVNPKEDGSVIAEIQTNGEVAILKDLFANETFEILDIKTTGEV
ncbi:acetoin utilization protein AcuB [Pilibacter termitis]|uniref:Acetoin utilization protein AcuB n=1 Tax=Pilibacter termitis TaxID=263852 RepID=A0A1T4NQ42_9ENTE|nr:CBS domain-containing protein [Pilibacter termitis]SJZ81312.1 acetoin utilization protein AcuB [Pilibacter termitis]